MILKIIKVIYGVWDLLMLTLQPPFRAENMEGLYQKVIKGQFGKINSRYSEDIFEMIND